MKPQLWCVGVGPEGFVPLMWEQPLHSWRCCRAEGGRAKGWGAANPSMERGWGVVGWQAIEPLPAVLQEYHRDDDDRLPADCGHHRAAHPARRLVLPWRWAGHHDVLGWGGMEWDEMGCSDMEWDGWDEVGCDGMGWNDMEWDGTGCSKMGYNGMECDGWDAMGWNGVG